MKKAKLIVPVLWILFLRVVNLSGQITDRIMVHGYGEWSYGKTNENLYLSGSKDGNFSYAQFALNISSKPTDKLTLVFQARFCQKPERTSMEFDYAFAQWKFADPLIFRIGKIKQPYGIYTEIYDIGTLRPFFNLPQGTYGLPGFGTKAYNGIGFTGTFFRGSDWNLQYDMYGGEIYLLEMETSLTGAVNPVLEKCFGGKLTLYTPIDGLNLSLSSFTGKFELEELAIFSGRYLFYASSVEYFANAWCIRSEYTHYGKKDGEFTHNSAYLEVGYEFIEGWQIAACYDWSDVEATDLAEVLDPTIAHEAWSLGINYWFSSEFVLKLSYHSVKGNRYAKPEDFLGAIMTGTWEDTQLVLFGAQFSF